MGQIAAAPCLVRSPPASGHRDALYEVWLRVKSGSGGQPLRMSGLPSGADAEAVRREGSYGPEGDVRANTYHA